MTSLNFTWGSQLWGNYPNTGLSIEKNAGSETSQVHFIWFFFSSKVENTALTYLFHILDNFSRLWGIFQDPFRLIMDSKVYTSIWDFQGHSGNIRLIEILRDSLDISDTHWYSQVFFRHISNSSKFYRHLWVDWTHSQNRKILSWEELMIPILLKSMEKWKIIHTSNREAVHVVDKIHKAEDGHCDNLSFGDWGRLRVPDAHSCCGCRGTRRRHLLDVQFVGWARKRTATTIFIAIPFQRCVDGRSPIVNFVVQ